MAWNLEPEERARIRRLFVITMCKFAGGVDLYWVVSERRLALRTPTALKRWPLPPDAVRIGAYSHPCPPEDFLGDLDALFTKLQHEAGAARA